MSHPQTLLQLAGADLQPPQLGDACLVIIDMQNEYLEGPLSRARKSCSPGRVRLVAPSFTLPTRAGQEACLTVMHCAVRSLITWHRLVTRP